MKVLKAGHKYLLQSVHGNADQELQFIQKEPFHFPCDGVLNQEVLRVLIDRIKLLNRELPWDGNDMILFHLRSAIILHEQRALMRKLEKGNVNPEHITIDIDGHFKLGYNNDTTDSTKHKP